MPPIRPVLNRTPSVLLVNYAGRPEIASLMPDNGLASLAAKLAKAGCGVKILDFSTPETLGRLVPPAYRPQLAEILRTFKQSMAEERPSLRTKARQAAALLKLKSLARRLEDVRQRVELEMAETIAQEARQGEADLVGFKLWNGDGFSGPVRMAEYLKRQFPGLMVAAGGPQVKFFKTNIFEVTRAFDALAVGDGEATILPLAEAAAGGPLSEVPNIFYSDRGNPVRGAKLPVHSMDLLPFPLYDAQIYPAMDGDQKIKVAVVEDRRGCENVCSFCVHPYISGRKPRSKSARRIVDEFSRAQIAYGISNFRLGGSSSPAGLLEAIADEIDMRSMKGINWTAFARINDSSPESFSRLREMGLYSLFFGIESGSQRVLDKMGKGVGVERIQEVIAASKSAGIFTVGSVIYPAPFDTVETRKETLALLREIKPDSIPLQFMGIYPGTAYAANPGKHNFEIVYPSLWHRILAGLGLQSPAKYDSPEVTRYLMDYNLQLMFPPRFWKPLPWKINGLAHKQFAAETEEMLGELKKAGQLMHLTDEGALMAHMGKYQPRDFAEQAFTAHFTGDEEAMAGMVKRVNSGNP